MPHVIGCICAWPDFLHGRGGTLVEGPMKQVIPPSFTHKDDCRGRPYRTPRHAVPTAVGLQPHLYINSPDQGVLAQVKIARAMLDDA